MTKKSDGGPAFPAQRMGTIYPSGMSLRQWYAGQALAGWFSSYVNNEMHPSECGKEQEVAKLSFKMADAMIKEGLNDE
jgi:hypothetical protein